MSHDHGHSPASGRAQSRRALTIALVLTGAFMFAEVAGGLITGSLALLADAAHMLSDALSLVVALGAMWLAARPTTKKRTFGWQRAEILAALFNGVTLVALAIWIFIEAGQRFADPPDVEGGLVLVVAVLGLAINGAAAWVLSRGEGESLNVAAALRHVLADILGSLGVIVAAAVILTTGLRLIDPIVSVLIGVLVLASSWSILRDSLQILLESAPQGVDADEIGGAMLGVPGVVEVHDLHVWTITSGFPALAAHVLVGSGDDCHARRRELEALLAERFAIDHTTLQVDHQGHERLLQLSAAEGLR
ncbi:MAG: cation diffusion facilitator family transporter [Actinomycetota bacterium]|nr:cation diffusion facilitator family transporter [Actinomycetota bacterium]